MGDKFKCAILYRADKIFPNMNKTNFLVMLFILTVTQGLKAQATFPDDLRGMPVSIKVPVPNGYIQGSGVFLVRSNELYLATAAHCLFNIESTNASELLGTNVIISSYGKNKDSTNQLIISTDLVRLQSMGRVRRHPQHDIAIIDLAVTMEVNGGRGTLEGWPSFTIISANPPEGASFFITDGCCMLFKDVSVGDDTYIAGYPKELSLNPQNEPIDFDLPLFRKGIISQKNTKAEKLVIDTSAYGGNSGGPVIVRTYPNLGVSQYQVAGIVTEFVPSITQTIPKAGISSALVNSGYCIAEPIDFAIDLMR